MTIAWYDPTNNYVSTYKNDPSFTPLGQLWPLDVKREWVGLTEDELVQLGVATGLERAAVGMISNKLKEKNKFL